jgi:hypothetical protein
VSTSHRSSLTWPLSRARWSVSRDTPARLAMMASTLFPIVIPNKPCSWLACSLRLMDLPTLRPGDAADAADAANLSFHSGRRLLTLKPQLLLSISWASLTSSASPWSQCLQRPQCPPVPIRVCAGSQCVTCCGPWSC